MQDRIKEILSYAREKLEKINSSAECQNLRVELLGKSGKITLFGKKNAILFASSK